MSPLRSFFLSQTPITKRLLLWKHNDVDPEFAERAIDLLVKKLKRQKGAIETLEKALSTPDIQTKCVTIPTYSDTKIQNTYRKKLPHVIYCQIWRWPDLESPYHLKPMKCCQYPFDSKKGEICINPYHYRKVEEPNLPAILVARRSSLDVDEVPMIAQESAVEVTPPNVGVSSFKELDLRLNFCDFSTIGQELSNDEAAEFSDQPPPSSSKLTETDSSSEFARVSYQEQQHWASIAYYELNCRVGEIFNCQYQSVIIDGFTNPSNNCDRFCLGPLPNINRNSVIENTRRHIGKGVHLYYAGGEVFVECWSDYAIFVQSKNANDLQGFHASTVCKIPSGESLKIFDNNEFARMLAKSVYLGFEAVYDLAKMCTIRISFVKGWGADYHRQDVTATPCWIEVHLHGPLQWLDRVLTQMGPPINHIGSVS